MTRRLLVLLVFFLLTLGCAAFARLNRAPVSIDLFFGVVKGSLAEALIGAVVVGWAVTMAGALAWGARLARHRRRLRNALKLAQAEIKTLRATAPHHAP